MTRKNHHRLKILICPTIVITDANDVRERAIRKKDPIKLCACLTEKLLTIAYISKIIKFKMDKDPLQHRIYSLTFVESLGILFSQCTETCDVLLDYPKIGDENMEKIRTE